MTGYEALLREWEADWKLAGRAESTMRSYVYVVRTLLSQHDDLDLASVKAWVAEADSAESQRFRGRAARAFLRWATDEEIIDASWWKRVPLVAVAETPQETVTPDQYTAILAKAKSARDRALVAVLWCSGLRVSEVCRMRVDHLDLDAGCVLIPESKTRKPRMAPLDPRACKALRVLLRSQRIDTGLLWRGERGALTTAGVRQMLQRLGAPPAHAWRRGWAVESLRAGVSQTSVQWAGGLSSPIMVSRYCRGLASELSMAEFGRRWAS